MKQIKRTIINIISFEYKFKKYERELYGSYKGLQSL